MSAKVACHEKTGLPQTYRRDLLTALASSKPAEVIEVLR
jgi:hypothetical protein